MASHDDSALKYGNSLPGTLSSQTVFIVSSVKNSVRKKGSPGNLWPGLGITLLRKGLASKESINQICENRTDTNTIIHYTCLME